MNSQRLSKQAEPPLTYESGLIEHGLKWSPIKIYRASLTTGRRQRVVPEEHAQRGELLEGTIGSDDELLCRAIAEFCIRFRTVLNRNHFDIHH